MTTGWAHHTPTRTAHALREQPAGREMAIAWCDRVLPVAELARISEATVRDPMCLGCLAWAPLPYDVADLPRHPPDPRGRVVTPTPARPRDPTPAYLRTQSPG
ncbi:MAG TPA: hypothetical protein VIL00_05300 [Pseudonocardiaceae bacterium]